MTWCRCHLGELPEATFTHSGYLENLIPPLSVLQNNIVHTVVVCINPLKYAVERRSNDDQSYGRQCSKDKAISQSEPSESNRGNIHV